METALEVGFDGNCRQLAETSGFKCLTLTG